MIRRVWLWILVFITSFIMVGCRPIVEIIPVNYERLYPPPVYTEWYAEVVACIGQGSYDFASIDWFVADAEYYKGPEEAHFRSANGAWIYPLDIILDATRVGAESTVKHEMVHLLLQAYDHASRFFDECVSH